MARVAVVHENLSLRGGGERVCMTALEALQEHHDVTLFTRRPVDIPDLNHFFNTEVDPATPVQTGADLGPELRAVERFGAALDGLVGTDLNVLQNAVFMRAVAREAREYDLVICTCGNFRFDVPAILYSHKYEPKHDGLVSRLYTGLLYDAIARENRPVEDDDLLATNSKWSANAGERRFGVRPEVLYPPVQTDDVDDGRPWAEREQGFLSVGRIYADKRVLEQIEIVAALRERGHDVHIHVVGPTHDGAYYDRVAERAERHDFVHLEGEVERARLRHLLATHRYGIHGRRPEHFGIAVAEMVAGGVVPFVPDAGGQREIVGEHDALLYEGVDDAVERISAVLDDPTRQRAAREALPDVRRRFGKRRFERRLRELVAQVLGADHSPDAFEEPITPA